MSTKNRNNTKTFWLIEFLKFSRKGEYIKIFVCKQIQDLVL